MNAPEASLFSKHSPIAGLTDLPSALLPLSSCTLIPTPSLLCGRNRTPFVALCTEQALAVSSQNKPGHKLGSGILLLPQSWAPHVSEEGHAGEPGSQLGYCPCHPSAAPRG